MALRFRRSIRLVPGIRLNVGLHGAGLSVGPRGLHVGVNRRGMYTSAGIPGTGIYAVHHIYDAFETDLARPLEMQDFDRQKQKKNQTMPEEKISVHPEYAMYLSTRDMARLGLLMLRDGKWKDKQLMPRNWASYLTFLYTPSSQVGPKWLRTDVGSGPMRWGYGALWWVWDEPRGSNPSDWTALTGAFSAMGTDGQFITVLPALDMVVAHMNYTIMEPPEKAVTEFEYQTILQMIIDAHCGDPGCK